MMKIILMMMSLHLALTAPCFLIVFWNNCAVKSFGISRWTSLFGLANKKAPDTSAVIIFLPTLICSLICSHICLIQPLVAFEIAFLFRCFKVNNQRTFFQCQFSIFFDCNHSWFLFLKIHITKSLQLLRMTLYKYSTFSKWSYVYI